MLKEAIHLEKLPVTNIGNNQFLVTESGINYVVTVTKRKTDHGDTIITIHTLDTKGRSRGVGDVVHYDASKKLLKDPDSGYEVFVNVQSEKEGGYPAPFQMALEKEGMQIEVPVAMNLVVESDSEDEEDEKKKKKKKRKNKEMNWKRFAKLGIVVSAMTTLDSIFMFTPRFVPPAPAVLDMCPTLLSTGLLENPFLAPPVNANLPEFGLSVNPPPVPTTNMAPTKTTVQGAEPLPHTGPVQNVQPAQLVPQVPVKAKQSFGPWGPPQPASVVPQGKKPEQLKIPTTLNVPFGPKEEPRPATIVPPSKKEEGTIEIDKYVAQSIISIIKANPSSAAELEKSLKGFDKALKFSGFRNTKSYKVVIQPYSPDDVTSEIIMKNLEEFDIEAVPPPKMNSKVESVKPLTMQLVSQIVTLSSSSHIRYSTIKQTIESLTQLHMLGVPEALQALPHAYAAMGSDKPSQHLSEISKFFRTPSVLKAIEERNQQPLVTLEMDTPTVSQVMLTVDNIKTKAQWVADHVIHGLFVTLPKAYSHGYSQTFEDPYADYSLESTTETVLTLASQVKNLGIVVSSTISNIPLNALSEKLFSTTKNEAANTGSMSLDSYANILGDNLVKIDSTTTLLQNATKDSNTSTSTSTKRVFELQVNLVNTCKASFNYVNKILKHEHYDIAATKHISNAWTTKHHGFLSWVASKADMMVCSANSTMARLPTQKAGITLNPVTQQSRFKLKQSHHLKQNPKQKTSSKVNVGTSRVPQQTSKKFLYLQEVPYLKQNPNPMSRPSDSLYVPFMSEPSYDEELYPFLLMERGILYFQNDKSVHDYELSNFYKRIHETIKKTKWHSKQVNQAVNLIVNDEMMDNLHKNNVITRIVCTYYLGRRGIDIETINDPVEEAIKDAGSLGIVFGRTLSVETIENLKNIQIDKNNVISTNNVSTYITNAVTFLLKYSLYYYGNSALNTAMNPVSNSLVEQHLSMNNLYSGVQYHIPSVPDVSTSADSIVSDFAKSTEDFVKITHVQSGYVNGNIDLSNIATAAG